MTVNWPAFVEIVNGNERFILTSHIRPDCDALGSALGMALVLDKLGKQVRIVNGQATPPNLDFIDPDHRIEAIGAGVQLDELVDADVHMVLDTSAWAQLGPMGDVIRATKARKIIVDHHMSEDDLGAENFKNTSAEATGRLVVEAADALGVQLTPEMAKPIYAAIATDTGWFRFPSTTPYTYEIAGRLIAAGAVPSEIYSELYERDSEGRVRLRGLMLSRIQTELAGRLVHTYVNGTDYEATSSLPTDTEDVINLALGVAGTEAAVIFVGQPSGGFKLSFRSKCEMDCSEVAEKFGGGGHKAAAGAFVEASLEDVREPVLEAVRTAMG
jgi:phosphoesterase RecJ-like protein